MDQFVEFVSNHPMLWLSFFVLVAWIIGGEILSRSSGVGQVGPMDAIQLINHKGAVWLDVRESREMEHGKIANAIHIPLSELTNKLNKLEKYKKKGVVAYCRSGSRSNGACARLKKNGFENVYNLRGGILAWEKEKLPLARIK